MIELKALTAGYAGCPVLREVSLMLRPGRVLILLGPNGGGKSTLLRSVFDAHLRISGQVHIDGVPAQTLSPRQIAQKVAYLPQSRSVPNIVAGRMVLHGRFPYLSYPRRYRREDYEAARRALQSADAEDIAGRPMQQLSGGQRQKVYLAMALAQDTETILMDEPTTYLDIRHQLGLMAVVRQMAEQGRSVVLVVHDLCLAMRFADEIAVLAEGRLVGNGTPDALYGEGLLNRVFGVALHRVQTADGWQYYCVQE